MFSQIQYGLIFEVGLPLFEIPVFYLKNLHAVNIYVFNELSRVLFLIWLYLLHSIIACQTSAGQYNRDISHIIILKHY